ncbi:MAG: mitochondrial carrier domain-containing protein [Monoraphidium minutum]|nr:MAG: mitochondrial carrier domain-containing protein [Monoraphidium minutum]
MESLEIGCGAVDPRERRRWLPFRLRLPLPGLGGAAPRGRAAPRRKSRFASASVALAPPGAGGAAPAAAAAGAAALAAAAPPAARGAASARAPAAPRARAPPPSAAAAAKAGSRPATRPASDVVAGALARAASQSIIHPLDTLKVRLQASVRRAVPPPPGAPGAAGAAPGLSKFGRLVPPAGAAQLQAAGAGLASLYKGVFGAASGAGIAIGAYFAFYSTSCNLLAAHTSLGPGSVAFLGGAAAAAGSSVVKVPLAVCIRSVQAGVYPNVFAAAGAITRAAGARGLFTGYWPTLLEDVPDMACKFAAYESMRRLHRRLVGGRDAAPGEDFAMGALAGAAAAAATTPLDVVKTRMMCAAASRPTMAGAAAGVLAAGGPGAFFAGVGARALSNGINSAVFFCAFEAIRGSLERGAAADADGARGGLEVAPLELPRDE